MMSAFKTSLCSMAILAAGTAVFAGLTHGFSVFTTEGALQASVQEAPRTVPAVHLQTADGGLLSWGAEPTLPRASRHPGHPGSAVSTPWQVVSFMYTRCTTVCSVQGAEMAQLQALLGPALARGDVALLSISFDPRHDVPAALRRWQARFMPAGAGAGPAVAVTAAGLQAHAGSGWQVARPVDDAGLKSLLDVFGVKAIPDGLGGFEHNAAFNLVNPQGQLVAVLDWADPQAAARRIRAEIGP
ncbi:SCO family protein [Castellaniella sp.]|uniref:SCO family protein n=1 Tax=Castellaniella sp. TaxID=1955812 RepID=UPI00355F43A5